MKMKGWEILDVLEARWGIVGSQGICWGMSTPSLKYNLSSTFFFTHCWSVSKDFHLFGCHCHHDHDHDHLYDDQLGEKAAPRLAQSRPSSSVCSSTSSFYHFPTVYENELDDDTCQGYDILPPSLPFCNASGSEDTWYGWYGTVMASSQMKIWSDIFTGQHCHRTQDFLRRSCSSQYPWWSRVLYIE